MLLDSFVPDRGSDARHRMHERLRGAAENEKKNRAAKVGNTTAKYGGASPDTKDLRKERLVVGNLDRSAGVVTRAGHEIGQGMRLPNTAHTSRPWRIHEIAPDFRLYDVWALPTPGGPDDFPRLVRQFVEGDTSSNPSRLARALFAIRWKLGALLGWDDPDTGVGSRVLTLRDRLPADLRDGPFGPKFDRLPFSSVYLTDDDWAAEMANRTVHAVMHMGWVPDGAGGYRGQMAVLVKPNGLIGKVYMRAIAPFRHLVVYPPLMREIGQEWSKPTRVSR